MMVKDNASREYLSNSLISKTMDDSKSNNDDTMSQMTGTTYYGSLIDETVGFKFSVDDKQLTKMYNHEAIKSDTSDHSENMSIDESEDVSYRASLKYIFSKPDTFGIFLIGFVFGGSFASVQSLLFVYVEEIVTENNVALIENTHDISYLLLGLSVGISVIFEIPFLYLSNIFIHYLGYRIIIIVSFILYCIRLVLYSYLNKNNLYLLLIIESLQGITTSLIHVSLITIISIIFPLNMQTIGQTLMYITRYGIAPFIFLIINGYIMEYYGGKYTFLLMSIICFISIILFYILTRNNKIFDRKVHDIYNKDIIKANNENKRLMRASSFDSVFTKLTLSVVNNNHSLKSLTIDSHKK